MSRSDPYKDRAMELARIAGVDPDSRVGEGRGMPAWCQYRDAARQEHLAAEAAALMVENVSLRPQEKQYQNAPLKVYGEHEQGTIDQMVNCMSVGNVVSGVLCADGHLGYAQPVGGVIAYENQISISGVGFDIACGNLAVRTLVKKSDIKDIGATIKDIGSKISFGVGRVNEEKVEAPFFDEKERWQACGMEDYRKKAENQLGTVGSGNHYVDLMVDRNDFVWIGVHFGSRGLGHTIATRHIKASGGRDGINVPPALVDVNSDIGRSYIAGMQLAGDYAYAGRDWVVKRVMEIIGAVGCDAYVHNHHNYAWLEQHNGRLLWVVRKGATPAWPGQLGFVGGSMGDDALIIVGLESNKSRESLYSTVHGAGRVFGRKEAKRRFTRAEMDRWINDRGVHLLGADLDESPMAYRRLDDVIAYHDGSVAVVETLRPFAVVMAGSDLVDPWRD